MGFLDRFKFEKITESTKTELQQSVERLLPGFDEDTYVQYTAIAGLMARVAYADMQIDTGEKQFMIDALLEWTDLDQQKAIAITELALSNLKTLTRLDGHHYCRAINEIFVEDEKYDLIRVLFQLSASDDEVTNVESEEIRLITKSLLLTHQHYISARAEVSDKLAALKSV